MKKSHSIIELDDYDGEWLIPLQIAKEANELNPILVCSTIEGAEYSFIPDFYQAVDGTPWYLPLTNQLTLIMEFSAAVRDDYVLKYQVFEVTNIDAYHLIWSRLSSNPIANYVFSSDCDLQCLKRKLSKRAAYTLEAKDLKSLATWSYWQQYGGGADEHFAFYYSKQPEQLVRFEYYLKGVNFDNRYQNIHCMAGDEKDARFFLTMKLDYQQQEECYFLFRKANASLLDVTNQEQHKQWWIAHNPDSHSRSYHECYQLDDLHCVLSHIEKLKNRLMPVLAIQPIEAFEHQGHQFKIIPVNDKSIAENLLKDDLLTDYMDGFFSIDTDLACMKKRIVDNADIITPEALLGLGEWAVVRMRDPFDGWPCVMATIIAEDLNVYISGKKKRYQDDKVNIKPIFHE